jgi:cold shock CspA family protein
VSDSIRGTVTAFDETRGRGVVTADDGRAFEFHSTRIADGTRRIPVGVAVTFETVPALRGRYEATAITHC